MGLGLGLGLGSRAHHARERRDVERRRAGAEARAEAGPLEGEGEGDVLLVDEVERLACALAEQQGAEVVPRAVEFDLSGSWFLGLGIGSEKKRNV